MAETYREGVVIGAEDFDHLKRAVLFEGSIKRNHVEASFCLEPSLLGSVVDIVTEKFMSSMVTELRMMILLVVLINLGYYGIEKMKMMVVLWGDLGYMIEPIK